jgi:diguanylate cyclase (GGDEF)-like protein
MNMAPFSGKITFTSIISALSAKDIVLAIIGAVLLVIGIMNGSAIIIIAVIFISVGLWGYVYFNIAAKSASSVSHHATQNKYEIRPASGSSGMNILKDAEEDTETQFRIDEDYYAEEEQEYMVENAEPVKYKQKERLTSADLTEFFDLESEMFPSSSEPRSEFEFLLGRVLAAIKESLIAHTAAFFWVNFDKQQLVFQGRASDSQNLVTERKLPLGNDIVSQIARSGKPEFISHINPSSERDILYYYRDIDFVKSFIGVPVHYQGRESGRTVVGVLAIDSKAEDAFGSETLTLLGQFTKLLTALIKGHTEKYDLLLDSELVLSIRKMHESMRENLDLRTIVQALIDHTKRLIGYDYFAVTMFNDDKRAWVVYRVDIADTGTYISPHQIINTDKSLVGTVLESNKHLLVDDLSTIEIPRFNDGEKIDSNGSILIAPISSFKKCYGTVSLERRDRSGYSARDIEVLYRLVENTAAALEILYMSELVDKYVIIDEATNVLKKSFFEQRCKDEIRRADDFGTDLTYVMLSIDSMQQILERFGKEGLDSAVYSFSKFLQGAVRQYDLIGRLDYNKFGVILLNTAASDGYLWAEKVRKNFASQVLKLNNKTTSITISSGVCGLTESMQFPVLTKQVTAALQKAVQSGGNTVKVY